MKYFLTSLWQLASTLYEVEKARAEKLEQSKLVLAIPINNSIMEIFQKNLNRWF